MAVNDLLDTNVANALMTANALSTVNALIIANALITANEHTSLLLLHCRFHTQTQPLWGDSPGLQAQGAQQIVSVC